MKYFYSFVLSCSVLLYCTVTDVDAQWIIPRNLLVRETAPTLGANLNANGKNITGVGHLTIIDTSESPYMLDFHHNHDSDGLMKLRSGNTTDQRMYFAWQTYDGNTDQWFMGRNAENDFILWDAANTNHVLTALDGNHLNVQPDGKYGVCYFANKNFGGAEDTPIIEIKRNSTADGNAYYRQYIDQQRTGWFVASHGFAVQCVMSDLRLFSSSKEVELNSTAAGDVTLFESARVGKNRYLRQAGYISTAVDEVEVRWQVSDEDDWFHLTRENTKVLGFEVAMPLAVTNSITLSEVAAPDTPPANKVVIYVDSADGDLKAKDDNGEVIVIGDFTVD